MGFRRVDLLNNFCLIYCEIFRRVGIIRQRLTKIIREGVNNNRLPFSLELKTLQRKVAGCYFLLPLFPGERSHNKLNKIYKIMDHQFLKKRDGHFVLNLNKLNNT
jgi:hypothetical protein